LSLSRRRWAWAGLLLWLAWVLLIGGGCSKREPQTYVARVDQSYLTEADLQAATDSASIGDYQAIDFVNSWIASELLYQEAVRRGLADTDELRQRLDQTRKRLAIDALLSQEIYRPDSALVSEQAVRELFRTDSTDLRLQEDVALLSYVLFSERGAANDFRSRVLRGTSWDDALRQVQDDSLQRAKLLRVVDRQYFTRATLYPEELWRLARTLPRQGVSFVVTTNAGFYVLIAHGYRRQGESPDWDYIRRELRARLLLSERRRLYDNLLAALRTQHTVELRFASPDTAQTEPQRSSSTSTMERTGKE
jgi:hypothetical protein